VHFSSRAAAWAVLLAAAGVMLGDEPASLTQALRWLSFGLGLGAFPAGMTVAGDALAEGHGRAARLTAFAGAAAALALVVLVVLNWGVPAAAGSVPLGEPWARTGSALSTAASRAHVEAERLGDDPASWLAANQLTWHLTSRIAAVLLLPLFAALGVLVGFWSAALDSLVLRRAFRWAAALLLVVGTYLVGENSYELLVLHVNGAATYAGWLVLVAPALLCLGLGVPTVLYLTGRLPPSRTAA
jgi:hypothetical protein